MFSTRRLGLVAAAILLLVLVGLSPSAPSRGSTLSDDPALAGVKAAGSGIVVAYDQPPPRIDEQGYTIWGGPVDYGNGAGVPPLFCVALSNILEYPIDLGGENPLTIKDISLKLVFDEYRFAPYSVGIYDPFWTVMLNQRRLDPPISAPLDHAERGDRWKTVTVAVDSEWLIEGRNGIRLSNDEKPWGDPTDARSHSTCIVLYSVELRGLPHDTIAVDRKSVSPKPRAKNVDWENPEIQVRFTKPFSEATVSAKTITVSYYDQDMNRVFVDGKVFHDDSKTVATFVPTNKLMDGVRYEVRVLGYQEENVDTPDQWSWMIVSQDGLILEKGYLWFFWTAPKLQVSVVPVQVVENVALVANKLTALKTFIRWDKKPEVWDVAQVDEVEVEDVRVYWMSSSAEEPEGSSWRKDAPSGYWLPSGTPLTRKREYLEFIDAQQSYTKREKLNGKDSVTYLNYRPDPLSDGMHWLYSIVELKTDKGKPMRFRSADVNYNIVSHSEWNMYFRALPVGSWSRAVTTTTNIDLSGLASTSRSGLKALFPVARIRPVGGTSLWSARLVTPTSTLSGDPDTDKARLISEMSNLCAQTDGCNVMFGVIPEGYIPDTGLVMAEYTVPLYFTGISLGVDRARFGGLLNYRIAGDLRMFRYAAAHESGHLQDVQWGDWDDENKDGESLVLASDGFDVLKKADKRSSVASLPGFPSIPKNFKNFMDAEPLVQDYDVWITMYNYGIMLNHRWRSAVALQETTSLPRLLASGMIVSTTNSVTLAPFYVLTPGEWEAPSAIGPFSIVILDNSSTVLGSYPFEPASEAPGSNLLMFDLRVPFPAGTTRIQIKRGSSVIKDVTASANAPTVNITSPAAGNNWSGVRTISWTGADADGDALSYAVQVSADNGASWQAIGTGLSNNAYSWDTSGITNTSKAMVRVMASDGLRSTATIAGPFTVSNPPTVTLISPYIGITNALTSGAIILAFSDDMDPATLTTGTITLRSGPSALVSGAIIYNGDEYEATFSPAVPLAYSTNYTVTVTTGARGKTGVAIPAPVSFVFRTEDDPYPPKPVAFSPSPGETAAPLDVSLAVTWDKDLKPSTVTPLSFTLATTAGVPIAGSVTYDSNSKTATFRPNASLAPFNLYVATLKAGIQDTAGNATESDQRWFFRTMTQTAQSVAFTKSFADYAVDDNADGLDDRLIIKVGVQVTATGAYYLGGTLVDASGEEIARVYTGSVLQPGAQFVDLTFPGAQIGGHGVDGPYTLTGLVFYKTDDPRVNAVLEDAYRTFAYRASQFYARLTFSGLPDVNLIPGASRDRAFNVRDYARHISLGSNQFTYSITMYTSGKTGVTLGSDGYVNIHPWSDWTGSSRITVRATAGNDYAEDTFEVNVGWRNTVNLPAVLKGYDGSSYTPSRSNWKTVFSENFEGAFPGTWALWSMYQNNIRYSWARRNCAASSGSYSGWPFGGNDAGSLLSCGDNYPNAYMGAIGYPFNINLRYVGQAEFRLKVWTDLDLQHDWWDFNEGDKICAMASTATWGDIWQKPYYGVWKTGQSQGWEDLVLDLANVPTLGNLLGSDQVWVAVKFFSDSSRTRPNGVFVDDISLRVCPAGLTCQ